MTSPHADNDITLRTYNDHIDEYVGSNDEAPTGTMKLWVDRVLARVPKGSRILELGSGYGRDANYMRSLGYDVLVTDGAQGFVQLLREKGFGEARELNALTDDFGTGYDMVFANGVFLHFTPGQLPQVLRKSYDCLKPGGTLAFSVKQGKGGEWSSQYLNAPRYFYFWERPALEQLVIGADFTSMEITERTGSQAKWLHVFAKK